MLKHFRFVLLRSKLEGGLRPFPEALKQSFLKMHFLVKPDNLALVM
jgi:hypothetical protein